MANIRVFRISASDWTDVMLPISASRLVLENDDPAKGFSYRSHADKFDSNREVQRGFGIEIEVPRGIRANEAIGQVKGGVIVVSVGMSLAQRVAVPLS